MPWLGDPEGILVGNFGTPPPRLGESEGFFVGIFLSEALGETDGDVVWRSKRGCPLVKWTSLGLMNVWNGCELVSVED